MGRLINAAMSSRRLLLCCFAAVTSDLVVYAPPDASWVENTYSVRAAAAAAGVGVGGAPQWQSSFTYTTFAPADAPAAQFGRSTSFTQLSFSEPVRVQIARLGVAAPWTRAVVRPLSAGVAVRRIATGGGGGGGGGAGFGAELSLNASAVGVQLSLEFDGDTANPLLLFANPLESAVPAAGSPGVLHFGRGVHTIAARTALAAHTRVYLAGGAVVYGSFASAAQSSNITIEGRGVLSGGRLPLPPGCPDHCSGDDALALVKLCGPGMAIRGIVAIDAPSYVFEVNPYWSACAPQAVACGGRPCGTHVSNAKAVAWRFTSDAISAGPGALVEDCFFKVNDDAVKAFQSDLLVRRVTIWQLDNGMPFMLSWNTPGDTRNITVRDCTVVHVEHAWDFGDRARPAVFGAVHGGRAALRGYLFEDIDVEGPVWRAFGLSVQPNAWAPTPYGELGDIDGVVFSRVRFLEASPQQADSLLWGVKADAIARIEFRDLEYGGKRIGAAAAGRIDLNASSTRNITFT